MSNTISSIEELKEHVKSQLAYHERRAERLTRTASSDKPQLQRKLANHKCQYEKFKSGLEFLNSGKVVEAAQSESFEKTPGTVSPHLHFIPEDLEGLPQELLNELNLSESDQLELKILEALRKAGGALSVDKLLVQLWHDTGEIHTRQRLAAKMYRMAAKGSVEPSAEHRGVYSLPNPQTNPPEIGDTE